MGKATDKKKCLTKGDPSASPAKNQQRKCQKKTKKTDDRTIIGKKIQSGKGTNNANSGSHGTRPLCSLWNLLNNYIDDGCIQIRKPMTQTAIVESITMKTISKENTSQCQLPTDLHKFIPNMIEFYLLMWERQRIYWGYTTTDGVLREFHFCNNYRELDRGTAYFRSQILDLYEEGSKRKNNNTGWTRLEWLTQVLAMSYCYRMCNRIESFTHPDNPVGGIPRLGQFNDEFATYVRSYKEYRKEPFFTAAHQTTNYEAYIRWCQDADNKSATSSEKSAIRELACEILDAENNDFEEVCTLVCKLKGVGDFFAWQIACDLEEAGCFKSRNVSVKGDYCMLGPGAQRGLEDIFGKGMTSNKISPYSKLQLCKYLRDNIDPCLSMVNVSFPYWKGRPVTLKVIEHALCEFNKYLRLDSGGKLRKRKSRSNLDIKDKVCHVCCQRIPIEGIINGGVRCDTCHSVFCTPCCQQENSPLASLRQEEHMNSLSRSINCCRRCYDLECRLL